MCPQANFSSVTSIFCFLGHVAIGCAGTRLRVAILPVEPTVSNVCVFYIPSKLGGARTPRKLFSGEIWQLSAKRTTLQ